MALNIDQALLEEFERHLDPRRPEESEIPARVLGYGEISTVFEIGTDEQKDIAYKRMPIFENSEELVEYEKIFREYIRLLNEEVGLELPPYDYTSLTSDTGRLVMFLAQKKLVAESVGNKAMHLLPPEETMRLARQIFRELKKVWLFNKEQDKYEIGIDGQISNWSIKGFVPDNPRLPDEIELVYFDTSTPLFRVDGVEQLDPELFLRSAPSFMVWLVRWLFLEDVMTRYYDFRLVAIDLVGNFYKEQLPEMIPELVDMANDFFTGEAEELGIAPITIKDVKSYYREDALIWTLYLSMREFDRFLRTKILRKEYPYILPGKIKRY
jgi:hypothetical protein